MRALAPVLPILILAACASDRYRPTTTEWNDDDSSSSSSAPASAAPPPAAAPPTDGKKLTAKDVAAAQPTADACQALAQTYYAQDTKRGLALLKACAGRSDFFTLKWILAGPWRKDVAAKEDLQLVVAEVIARRGGFVEADTLACRKAGVPIYDIANALEEPKKATGKLVLARGAVDGAVVREKQPKGGSIQVASFVESTWADDALDENQVPIALQELQANSGRAFFAIVEPDENRLVQKKQSVVALRFQARRDSGEDPSVIGPLAGLWPANAELTVGE